MSGVVPQITEHNYVPIKSWNFTGASWGSPNPFDPRYYQALVTALYERAVFAGIKHSIPDMTALAAISSGKDIQKYAPWFFSSDYFYSHTFVRFAGMCEFIRRLIAAVAPGFVNEDRLQEYLSMKRDVYKGEKKGHYTKTREWVVGFKGLPYHSYASLSKKHPGITRGCDSVGYGFDTEYVSELSKFISAAKDIIDDLFLVEARYENRDFQYPSGGISGTEFLGGLTRAAISKHPEGSGDFSKKEEVIESPYLARCDEIKGVSGYPGFIKYPRNTVANGEYYARKEELRDYILKDTPNNAVQAAKDAVAMFKDSPGIDIDESKPSPNPIEGGKDPANEDPPQPYYHYPRTDAFAKYGRAVWYSLKWLGGGEDWREILYHKSTNLYYGPSIYKIGGGTLSLFIIVKGSTRHFFYWEEPHEDDDDPDEYDHGSEDLGPLYSAELTGQSLEFTFPSIPGFSEGLVYQLYTYAYAYSSSEVEKESESEDSRSAVFHFSPPPGEPTIGDEYSLTGPIDYKPTGDGKFTVRVGSIKAFPTDIRSPPLRNRFAEDEEDGGNEENGGNGGNEGDEKDDGDEQEEEKEGVSYNGYRCRYWGFFNGKNAFRFKAT